MVPYSAARRVAAYCAWREAAGRAPPRVIVFRFPVVESTRHWIQWIDGIGGSGRRQGRGSAKESAASAKGCEASIPFFHREFEERGDVMKVICDRAALVDALTLVTGVIATRTPKPVLECVRLDAANGMLTLSGTDLEAALRLGTARVEIQQDGAALLKADKLTQICRSTNDATLAIEVKDEVATIRGQGTKFTIYGHKPDEFPSIPDPGHLDPDFTIDSATLVSLIDRTIFATARENSRYAINGVLIKRNGKNVEFVATDGRRLALAKGKCNAAGEGESQCIVPTKALSLLAKLAADPEAPVAVTIEENRAIFIVGEEGDEQSTLSSNLVEGAFPPYQDVIPKDLDKKAVFDVETLETAVRQAALLTNEESKGIRLAFNDEGLSISSRAPELGEAEISVPFSKYDGGELEIGFNPTFISDALRHVEGNEVNFELKAPNKPGMMKSGNDFLYVLMPVSLN